METKNKRRDYVRQSRLRARKYISLEETEYYRVSTKIPVSLYGDQCSIIPLCFLQNARYDLADYFHSSPVVNNGVVYFGSGNGRFNAVSAENGETIWSFKAGDIIHNTPVIAKDKIYFGCFDGFVYALDIRSGQVVWKFKSVGQQYFPNGEMQGSPSTGHGSIFIGGRDYNLYAINSTGGYANWNRKFQGGWALSTTVEDTVLYVGTSDDRLLLALDARNGQEFGKRT